VLNTFAYTGSLSVAAGLGGADHVTTLDLSRPSTKWAEENWRLNELSEARARFIAGDVFEWLPRLKKSGERFDCVILDPPSFARGSKGSFSTAKDLPRLHEAAIDVLSQGGLLVTSINSADISWSRLEADIERACTARRASFSILRRVDLPESFPTPVGEPEKRYLKGYILSRLA
jgi:23S rRNA (cytosine1962-C5)-methyltransferase